MHRPEKFWKFSSILKRKSIPLQSLAWCFNYTPCKQSLGGTLYIGITMSVCNASCPSICLSDVHPKYYVAPYFPSLWVDFNQTLPNENQDEKTCYISFWIEQELRSQVLGNNNWVTCRGRAIFVCFIWVFQHFRNL